MKIKTADLTGPALDWAVAKCEKEELSQASLSFQIKEYGCLQRPYFGSWKPSSSWAQGGLIIEREELGLKRNAPCSQGREWEASPSITAKGAGGKWGYGPTPLIAAMRGFVASRLGAEVDIPEELLS